MDSLVPVKLQVMLLSNQIIEPATYLANVLGHLTSSLQVLQFGWQVEFHHLFLLSMSLALLCTVQYACHLQYLLHCSPITLIQLLHIHSHSCFLVK